MQNQELETCVLGVDLGIQYIDEPKLHHLTTYPRSPAPLRQGRSIHLCQGTPSTKKTTQNVVPFVLWKGMSWRDLGCLGKEGAETHLTRGKRMKWEPTHRQWSSSLLKGSRTHRGARMLLEWVATCVYNKTRAGPLVL